MAVADFVRFPKGKWSDILKRRKKPENNKKAIFVPSLPWIYCCLLSKLLNLKKVSYYLVGIIVVTDASKIVWTIN